MIINSTNDNTAQVLIYDSLGRIVLKHSIISGVNMLDVAFLSSGIYTIFVGDKIELIVKK
ncbi:MAG: T9SS type A sorting domain-containing protein [Crocinitomix sp.]|nr:T9SS type A sorting domain-containing protein [Crocinitomix sp.]